MWPWLVSGGLLVFAAAFVVGGVLHLRDHRRFLVEGVPVRGRVTETFSDVVNEDLGVRVEYHLDGRRHVVEFRAWKKDVRVGEEVALRCLRGDPPDARRDRPQIGKGDAIMAFAFAGVAAIAAAVIIGLRVAGIV